MKKIFFGTLFFLLILPSGYSQENLTLSDAILTGLENNYQIRIMQKNIEIAENNNTWGNAGMLPKLDLSLSNVNRYDDQPSQINLDDRSKLNTTRLTPGASLGWNLFNGFAVAISKKNFETLQELSEGNAALVVENNIQGIVLAYYKILLEKEKLDVLNQLMSLSKDRYDYLLTKKEIGNAVTFDVLQAQNAFLSDSSLVLMQMMNLRSAEMNLNLLMAVDSDKKYTLTDELNVPVNQYELGDLITKMKQDNKALQMQYINQRLYQNATGLSKSALYPNLRLSAGTDKSYSRYKYEGASATNSNSFDYYANFSLSFNLFNGGQTRTAIQNAKIQEEIAGIEISELEHTMQNLLITIHEFYNVRRQLFLVSEENLKSSKLNMEIASEKFRAGTINSFNYRDVQVQYLNAAFSRLEAIYDLVDTNTELLRITGGIIGAYK
ncbi:MAG: TolC family protein [Bacteroidales bacterium]|nr:TolC family protein [Bacteroidales bacterium]MCF8454321.1 TolC family protein [Bacteroidales bacterium]